MFTAGQQHTLPSLLEHLLSRSFVSQEHDCEADPETPYFPLSLKAMSAVEDARGLAPAYWVQVSTSSFLPIRSQQSI